MDYVFVYGTLKRGYWNAHFLDNAIFIDEGKTDARYALLDLTHFPGLVVGNRQIQGEVYKINASILKKLDFLEGYDTQRPEDSLYTRILIPITLNSGKRVRAFTYLFNNIDGTHRKILDRNYW